MEGRCPGLQGAAVLWHTVPAAGSRRALMKSRGNYSCQALWSQGHVFHLQGHRGIIWGVACTHSAAEKEIFFFSYHIWHMVCQRMGTRSAALMSWLGVFRPQLYETNESLLTLPEVPTEFIHYQVWTAITESHQIAFACYAKRHFSKKKILNNNTVNAYFTKIFGREEC